MAEHNNMGYWGEQQAASYLEANGYGIMARNWRLGHRDLDIVAHKDGTVVFVEVKTRRDNRYMEAEQAVDARNAVADLDDRAHFARLDADVQLLQLLLQRLVDGLCGDFSH